MHYCKQTQRATIVVASCPVGSYNRCGDIVRSFDSSVLFDRRFEDGKQSTDDL
jgi:hypothetical protein